MILGFDTETTGLPLYRERNDDPRQPHILQIAGILFDMEGREVYRYSTLVKPGYGAEMHPDAYAAHGISLDRARLEGADPVEVATAFLEMVNRAVLIVGHNISFDLRLLKIFLARHLRMTWEITCETFCTMWKAHPFTRTGKAGANGKNRSLNESYEHFFGPRPAAAHDALNDIEATLRLFWHLTRELNVPMFKKGKAA